MFWRNERFAKFARTVELGLVDFAGGRRGSEKLLQQLLAEYGTTVGAQRQICILFSLLDEDQPVQALRALLRRNDNATISAVEVVQGGRLLAPQGALNISDEAVTLALPAPFSVDGARQASLQCKLKALDVNRTKFTVESVEVQDPGSGYSEDMDLPLRFTAVGLRVEAAPVFAATATREPAQVLEGEPKNELKKKFTALLPSTLLPRYSAKLDRVVPDSSVPFTRDPSKEEEQERLDEFFGNDQLDRFRAEFVFAEFDSTYGPVGLSPLERERRLSLDDYMRFAICGGVANFIREVLFLPVKNVKVRMQTDARLGKLGMTAVLPEMIAKEPGNLYRAVDVSAAAAIWVGVVSFGVTEYLKRELVINFPGLSDVAALVIASAVAVFASLLLYAPFEALGARIMAGTAEAGSDIREADEKEPPFWGFAALQTMFKTTGLGAVGTLMSNYWLLAGREMGFVITKFVVFDSFREGVLFLLPYFVETQSLLVACLCGAVAGGAASVVSHPIDTIFAMNSAGQGSKDGELPSLERLYAGVVPRILIYSPGIAVTFLVYDFCKTALGVGTSGLLQTFGVLQPP
eukprot:TRINITY_DN34802_c0_g3_i3.p1 TRINITY_DN34802_c0_g3~~TRINITY_DN34802_c0_g3_i3.p1  ORF type:complete len:577 (-),score=157.80 TRINITY_DN34802_c0_g3_i3:99-1829(-)